jgi:hypothetical protein
MRDGMLQVSLVRAWRRSVVRNLMGGMRRLTTPAGWGV